MTLIARLSAPLATFAAMLLTTLPVFAANDCSNPDYNLMPVKLNLISLPAKFCAAEGGLNPSLLTIIITGLNAIAIGIVLVLGLRLVAIGVGALSELNSSKMEDSVNAKGEMAIVQQAVLYPDDLIRLGDLTFQVRVTRRGQEDEAPQQVDDKGLTILVVDDDARIRDLLRRYLNQEGSKRAIVYVSLPSKHRPILSLLSE